MFLGKTIALYYKPNLLDLIWLGFATDSWLQVNNVRHAVFRVDVMAPLDPLPKPESKKQVAQVEKPRGEA